jgi:hypothetical protein
MQRRDVPKLLASLAAAPTTGASQQQTSTQSLQQALSAHGAVRIPMGTHSLSAKLQTLVQNDIAGDSRHDTVLVTEAFADYILEVGNGIQGPNAGRIARLRFYGTAGNRGCLHMGNLSHMWHLDDLLFSGGPCPALVVDNCWDSNYTSIDILGHVTPGSDPAKTSAVIFKSSSNNIYCRGLRIEGALSGGIYTEGGPIYVITGKIDDGFGKGQTAAAVTVAPTGYMVIDDFYFGGMLNQYHIDVAGFLRLGKVVLDGGTGTPAAIRDRRAWAHINSVTYPGYSAPSQGPFIQGLDLGDAQFRRFHPSVNSETPAAVYSRIHPIRQVKNLTVRANRDVQGNTLTVSTDLRDTHNDLHKLCYLVHNSTATRRLVLNSFVGGSLLLEGTQAVTTDSDWSIEYCETHDTPIRHERAWLDRGQTLFAVVARGLTLVSAPIYVSDPADAAYGTTKVKIDLIGEFVGLFLADETTGAAFYIEYSANGYVGVMYDRRAMLDATHTYSVTAGHVPA